MKLDGRHVGCQRITIVPGKKSEKTLMNGFKEDLKSIGGAGLGVTMLLGLLATGLPGLFHVVGATKLDWELIKSVTVATAPLTIWVSALTLGFVRRWFDDMHPYLLIIVSGLLMALVTAAFDSWFGGCGIDVKNLPELKGFWGWLSRQFAAAAFLLGTFRAYTAKYGIALFASSIVVGIFYGWAVGCKLWPRLAAHMIEKKEKPAT